jgi:deoxyribose-phosphate aldolase
MAPPSLNIPSELKSAKAFAELFDHTLLRPDATPDQIRALCRETIEHGFKGVCVNPGYVALASKELAAGKGPIPMAVVGFPLGANRTDTKIDEAMRAIGDGAWELDMVLNVGLYLGGEKTEARKDIAAVVKAARGVGVKVILETAFLNEAQIKEVSHWCLEAGATFVKTSTGFGPRGASLEDIRAMAAAVGGRCGIKASGGVKTLEAVLDLVQAGATRVGSSGSVKILSDFKVAAGLGR